MRHVARGSRQVGGDLGDLARVRFGHRRAVHRLLESRSGDQLHRPRDLADVADRLTERNELAKIGRVSWKPASVEQTSNYALPKNLPIAVRAFWWSVATA